MNVGKLRKIIENAPDDMVILIPGGDHNYYEAVVEISTALKAKREWVEDFGEESTPEKDWGTRTPALIVRTW